MRLKIYFLISLIFWLPITNSIRAQENIKLIILPFEDESGFGGDWHISKQIPAFVAVNLDSLPGYSAIPPELLFDYLQQNDYQSEKLKNENIVQKILNHFSADYAVGGFISDFELAKFNLGSIEMGRFSGYDCFITSKNKIYRSGSDTVFAKFKAEAKIRQRGLEFTPAGIQRKRPLRFTDLDTMKFAGKSFMNTIAGVGLKKYTHNFLANIQNLIPVEEKEKSIAKTKKQLFQIIAADEEFAHINAGKADGVNEGDIFLILAEGDSLFDPGNGNFLGLEQKLVGKLEVMVVKENHLSWARILEKKTNDINGKKIKRIKK